MNFEQGTYTQTTPDQKNRSEGMATASMVLGILALVTCSCIYSAVICGALGIILALLSRGGENSLDARGTAGLVLSSIGLAISFALYIGTFSMMMYQYGGIEGILQEYMKLYQADTIEELYQNMGIF